MSAPYEPTTANTLAAYRDELLACGFSADEVRELVSIAARNLLDMKVNAAFADHAAAPAPIGPKIWNHEPGSPEDFAARAEYGRLFIRMWDDATPQQRVEMAERVVTESGQARRCFLQNHEWRIENLQGELRRAQEAQA